MLSYRRDGQQTRSAFLLRIGEWCTGRQGGSRSPHAGWFQEVCAVSSMCSVESEQREKSSSRVQWEPRIFSNENGTYIDYRPEVYNELLLEKAWAAALFVVSCFSFNDSTTRS